VHKLATGDAKVSNLPNLLNAKSCQIQHRSIDPKEKMAVHPQTPPGDNMSLPAASSEDADEKMAGTKPEQVVRDDVNDVHNSATAIPEGDGAGPMPSKMSFILIIAGLCLAVFLVAIVSGFCLSGLRPVAP
jgi:hypothetical protein